MYCHIIPQVYQKSWHSKNGESNVFYFDKSNLENPLKESGGNVNKNLGEKDYYILKQKDVDNGIEITDIKYIENGFSNKIENNWNLVLETINELISQAKVKRLSNMIGFKKEGCLELEQLYNNLIDFIIMQFIRDKENFKYLDSGKISKILKDLKIKIEETLKIEVDDLSQDEKFCETIWKNSLLASLDNDSLSLSNIIKELLNKCSIVILYSEKDELILSDNPILFNIKKDKKYKELESGIYMSINPKVLVVIGAFIEKAEPGDFVLTELNTNFAKYLNFLLTENAIKYVGNTTDEIKSKINASFDFDKDWYSMFK